MSEWHKSYVVSGGGLGERLVVHLHRLNLSGQLVGGEGDDNGIYPLRYQA